MLKNYPYKYRDYSYIAAEALLAAGEQGKYWEMHDVMLENSPTLDKASLVRYAGQLGLDAKRFAADLESGKHRAAVEKDVALALSLDLYNTPTLFINGRKVVGNRPYDYVNRVVQEELSGAGR